MAGAGSGDKTAMAIRGARAMFRKTYRIIWRKAREEWMMEISPKRANFARAFCTGQICARKQTVIRACWLCNHPVCFPGWESWGEEGASARL